MVRYIPPILLLFSTAVSFGQDLLMKRDSSRIEAKILEIRPAEIKYKYFNYQDGPTLIIHKNEIAYVIYQNGQSEYFPVVLPKPNPVVEQLIMRPLGQGSNPSHKKDSIRQSAKLPDYLTLNVDAGIVLNESYANKPYSNSIRLGSQGSPEYEDYYAPGKSHINCGYSFGVNLLAGKSPFCKYLTGITYVRSTGEFNYEHTKGVYNNEYQTWIGYEKAAHYKSTVHYLNLLTGIRFIICKRICIDNTVFLNIPVRAVNTVNGYETNYKQSYSNYYAETHYYNNEITHDSKANVTVSFVPKLSYEFNIAQQKLGVYFSYNISYKYNLPWYMIGVSYYPFKKLR